MGYKHWRLGKGDAYQLGVARMRVAALLDAHASGVEGPLALACEVPIEEWDDIVEYGADNGCLTVTHYQVKLQNTNFKAGEKTATFGSLFDRAARILDDAAPYEGLTVPPEKRFFRFVFPTDDIKVGSQLGIDQLRLLLESCSGNAADAIVGNGGANLLGKDGGDQAREWLRLIRNSAGSDSLCACLLRQMRVELQPFAAVENDGRLAALFDDPTQARILLDTVIRKTAPEGWLDAEELLPKLVDARPKPAMRQVRIAQHEDLYYAHPYVDVRMTDLRAVAEAVVEKVWAENGGSDLHVSFPLPEVTASEGARALRLACVRLLLHAARSPIHVTGQPKWFERTRMEVARVLGVTNSARSLAEDHFHERAAPVSLPPKASWSPMALADALHAAMDARMWKRVRREVEHELLRADVSFQEMLDSLMGLNGFLERVLHGWWGLEQEASGVARAGPANASNVGLVVAGLAVIRHAGYHLSASDEGPGVAKLGALPVRALAIERAAVTHDREPIEVNLSQHARDLLDQSGIVLIVRGNVDSYYSFATSRLIIEPAAHAGLQHAAPAALLMDSDSLVTAAITGGGAPARQIKEWCDTHTKHHGAALEAALQQWRESHAT